MISLGCPKNQVDAEHMLALLEEAGCEIVDYFDGCDVLIINTCGFIDDAKKEAIESILDAAEMKKENTVGKIIVTGCLSQRYKNEVISEIPEVDAVIGIGANGDIVRIVGELMNGSEPIELYPPRSGLPLEGERMLTTPGYWAYLKIADGCSNHCTYCTIPGIRGEMRSRTLENIIDEARRLALGGVKELILVAQDTTSYGCDIYGEPKLPELLDRLSGIEGIEWIRMLYCYPDRITDELIETIKTHDKVLDYIDLPLQHINDGILSAMNRRGTSEDIRNVIARLRMEIPDIVIRTTFIIGFPGEGDDEFAELVEFVNETEFDRLGCFAFSPQEGTPACDMEGAADEDTVAHRIETVMEDQYEIIEVKNEEKIGRILRTVVESYDPYTDSYTGRTYMDAPEIDGSVKFTSPRELDEGDFADVRIFGVDEYDLLGEVI